MKAQYLPGSSSDMDRARLPGVVGSMVMGERSLVDCATDGRDGAILAHVALTGCRASSTSSETGSRRFLRREQPVDLFDDPVQVLPAVSRVDGGDMPAAVD